MEETRRNYHPTPRRRRRRRRARWPLYVLALGTVSFTAVAGISALAGEAMSLRAEASYFPEDRTPPALHGVKDLTVYSGDTVLYLAEVTATDDQDPYPRVEADGSLVDLTTPGEYTVYYRAEDSSGNESRLSAHITVLDKADDPALRSDIDRVIDEVLADIITPDMSDREQVEAIYAWAKENLRYSGHTDRSNYAQGGYEMLTTGMGDCYGYFALTKLMLERLEIPNIDVEKLKDNAEDSDHYWSLVSVDGGNSWYHFDATPRMGQTEELCLVTDLFLASFDTFHDDCHQRDLSKYPATPEGWK